MRKILSLAIIILVIVGCHASVETGEDELNSNLTKIEHKTSIGNVYYYKDKEDNYINPEILITKDKKFSDEGLYELTSFMYNEKLPSINITFDDKNINKVYDVKLEEGIENESLDKEEKTYDINVDKNSKPIGNICVVIGSHNYSCRLDKNDQLVKMYFNKLKN
ncbi:MAG: hypothetical protein RR543_04645 [Erysipelotrichales bacterium]